MPPAGGYSGLLPDGESRGALFAGGRRNGDILCAHLADAARLALYAPEDEDDEDIY